MHNFRKRKELKNFFKESLNEIKNFRFQISIGIILAILFHYLGFDEFSLGGFDFHLFFFAAIAAYFAFFLNFFSYIMVLIFTGLINTLLETRANFQENIILFLTIIVIFLFLKVFVSTYRKKKSISRYFAFLDFVSIYVSLSIYHIAFHFFILKKPLPYILKSSEFYYSTIIIVFAVLLLEQLHQISSQKENVKERNILFKFIIIPFLVFIFALSVVVFVSNSYLIFTFNKIESSTRNVFNNEAIYSSHLYGQIFMRTFEGAKNYCRSLVKLPGVQWRTKNLIALARQRIEEFFSMGVDIGVDSYFIISEKGNLELYVGLKPSYSSVNKIFEQVNSVYPGTYSKDAISLKVFDNIDNKIYFCMPIYRTTTNPAGGLKPDGKRNGFLVCAIDLNYMLESVQRNLNQKSRLHFFVYEYGGKFNVVSHSLSISDLTKKKMELAKESAIKIAEKAVRSDNQVVFVKDNFVQAAYPVGGLRNLCSVAFLPIESYSRRIEDAKRNLRRLILSSSLFSFFIALAVFSFFSIFASILQNQLKLKEKELEEEIERKYEILETVLKDLPLGILLVNSEGEIKFSNDFGKFFIQRETGKTPDTIKNTSFEHVLEIFQSDVDLKRTEIVSGSRIYGTTARIVDFKGEKLLNIVLSDITEIRQIQQAALVESRSIILGELAKNFSTMISDPLQLALAKLEVLIAKFKDDRNIIEFLKDIEDSLEKVVEASYGIGSLSSGVVQYEEGMISIKDIMKRVIDIMKPSFNRYGIEFELKIEDEKMLFKGILSRLELILVSILSMAINLLQVNNLEENKKIQIEVKPLDGMGRITVNWIGHQLTKEEIEMLGKPYYTESTKGRILNLFVAKQLAIKEGGTLEVHRSENGMVVILDYPLAE